MEQPEYNMFTRQRVEHEYLTLYREIGLGTTIWSPLASGMLTGKYNNGIPEGTRVSMEGYGWLREWFESEKAKQNIEKVKQLIPLAEELGASMPQLALAWCLKNPNVSTVITGASRVEQVIENLKALEVSSRLDDSVLARIEEILQNKPDPEENYC
jgi:aryl-alcohol dehydrogenase-like predicted oxidoreductase